MSNRDLQTGTAVKWKWGTGWGQGKITKKYTQKTSITINDTKVVREASADEPAYLIEQEDGTNVLKSHTEIEIDR